MQQQQQETTMNTRNPVAASFASGINRPQFIGDKRHDRRAKHRAREFESLDDG